MSAPRNPTLFALLALALLLASSLAAAAGASGHRNRPPKNVKAPRITGPKAVGRSLIASRGRWSRHPTRYRYSWRRCDVRGRHCHAVSGGRERVYRLVARDAGSRIRVVVTASNRGGSASAWSKSTSIVAGAGGGPPPPPAPPPPPPPPPGPPPPPPPGPPPSGRVIMEFDQGWAPTGNMPWNDLTQVVLFALQTQNGPGLDTHLITDIDVPAWVGAAHAHGVKPFISIGGSDDQNWHNACNDTNRAQFVQSLVNYATSNGFDGIDLDPEDQVWGAHNPPVQAMTDCIVGVSNAAHAVGLLVSADVITNWEGPWFAPSQAYVDQFNLMTYGDNLATMQADVQDTINQGLPASKFVVGVDVDDYPDPPPGGCGQFSNYATQAGLMGAFVWAAFTDGQHGNVCANGLATG